MTVLGSKVVTEQEYLELDLLSEEMIGYFDGHIVEKPRGNGLCHSTILSNLIRETGVFLADGSSIFSFELRVATPSGSAYAYPDIVIVEGNPEIKRNCFDTLLNPSILMEVTSHFTGERDAYKFFYYSTIPSLKPYFIIDANKVAITAMTLQSDNSWKLSQTKDMNDILEISAIGMQLSVRNIYNRVSFANRPQ